jgi:hypothetical protein
MVGCPVFGSRFDLLTSHTKQKSDRTPVPSAKAEVQWSNTYLACCTFGKAGRGGGGRGWRIFYSSYVAGGWLKTVHYCMYDFKKSTLVQALRLCTGRTAHRGSKSIALLFHDHGTRRGWGVSVTPRPLFTPRKDSVPIVQEAGWAQGRSGQLRKSRHHRDSIPRLSSP